jgi:hypothetical protein
LGEQIGLDGRHKDAAPQARLDGRREIGRGLALLGPRVPNMVEVDERGSVST